MTDIHFPAEALWHGVVPVALAVIVAMMGVIGGILWRVYGQIQIRR